MKALLLFCVVVVAVVHGDNGWHTLNEFTLPRIWNGRQWIVMAYVNWCGHCQDALPSFKEYASQLPEISNIQAGLLDCTNRAELCMQMGFTTWPSIVGIKGTKAWTYAGSRSAKSIEQVCILMVFSDAFLKLFFFFFKFASNVFTSNPPDREIKPMDGWSIIIWRIGREVSLTWSDLQALWESHDDSVYLLVAVGLLLGLLVGWMTWSRGKAPTHVNSSKQKTQ